MERPVKTHYLASVDKQEDDINLSLRRDAIKIDMIQYGHQTTAVETSGSGAGLGSYAIGAACPVPIKPAGEDLRFINPPKTSVQYLVGCSAAERYLASRCNTPRQFNVIQRQPDNIKQKEKQ